MVNAFLIFLYATDEIFSFFENLKLYVRISIFVFTFAVSSNSIELSNTLNYTHISLIFNFAKV